MSSSFRTATLLAAFLACSAATFAATPKEIDAAIKKGTDALKAKYAAGPGGGVVLPGDAGHGIGPTCLAGLALLEGGVPAADPAVKKLTEQVRGAAYRQTKTYQVSLCLMYLDRHGDPADVPLIQALAVRLLVGQSGQGGWSYDTVGEVTKGDEDRLRAMKPGPAGKLHPDVEEYAKSLVTRRAGTIGGSDNSNTQFAVLAVWLARKHGVPVDNALDLIERRFLASQFRTGNWPYNDAVAGDAGIGGSPSMYCAGLIGLATAVARREEKKPERKEEPKQPPGKEPPKKSDDPFFNPPPKEGAPPPKKKDPPRPLTATDRAIQGALAGLGGELAASARAGRGALTLNQQGNLGHGRHDLYFYWSLERVGVIYGVEKIGGVDWYEAGAHTLVHSQLQDGTWSVGYGTEIDTSFAVLFLSRSNLARDLSGKVQKETATEMKAGSIPGLDTKQTEPVAGAGPAAPPIVLPGPTGSQAAVMVGELLRAPEKDWSKVLEKFRDSKGPVYTQALLGAVSRLEGDRRKAARDALAERLTRMSAATLREMAKYEDAELRRAAILAMAMKDDNAHIPDLVAAILDEEDVVVRAARAGLKSLTGGEDFGPAANATAGEKLLAEKKWQEWLSKHK